MNDDRVCAWCGSKGRPVSTTGAGNFQARPTALEAFDLGSRAGAYVFQTAVCHSCSLPEVWLNQTPAGQPNRPAEWTRAWPVVPFGKPAQPEVQDRYAKEYEEARAVLPHSAKASAALTRRILQLLLVEQGGADPNKKLHEQIAEVAPNLKSHLDEESLLHALRHTGNTSAHPQFDQASGEIVDVDGDQAEYMVDMIHDLFDTYFVAPEKAQRFKDSVKAAQAKAGKTAPGV